MKKILILLMLIFLLFISCKGEMVYKEKISLQSLNEIPESNLSNLSNFKIYFGHQSVGYNIIDGIRDISKEYDNIKLNILETEDALDFAAPIFAHSRVGENRDPISKIDTFSEYMDNGIGNLADIAFFKFCYIDFDTKTDINMIIHNYRESMSRLKDFYPDTAFVHVTVPLVARQTGLKSNLKKVLGQPRWGYDDNIKRYQFNQLLKNEYGSKEPIFDLAMIESTHPDGTQMRYEINGSPFYALIPEYTSDGGHLNEKGRRIVAEQLLIFLSNLTEK